MDLKRFDEIDGLDVLKRLSREESIYNTHGNELYIDDCKMWMSNSELTGVVNITIADILNGKWYVKKPFDVRAEMLSRPNEWVGAFKIDRRWVKAGFCSKRMTPVFALFNSLQPTIMSSPLNTHYLLNNSVPVEDVPKEDLQ